ncbi:MAG: hypothetical protein M1819_001921 [Sarea resinae]|nr:MAG: hypothetical protein M1819_001921 [Sarea resinae]
MSSITLKLTSLVIRTLSKPIANQIKAQAREHERFRRICVKFAQSLHRVDMRLRLGLLRDSAAIERQMQREAAEAAAKKKKAEIPTVKTEAQMKADQAREAREAINKDKDNTAEKKAAAPPKPKIRPLSEAKAIDSGANFISETFLFVVAGGLILFESYRSRRKETTRHEDVSDRLGELEASEKAARRALVILEKELIRLKAEKEGGKPKKVERILPKEVWELEELEEKEDEGQQGWVERVKKWYGEKMGGEAKGSQGSQDSKDPNGLPSPPIKPTPDAHTQPKTEAPASS